MDVNRAAQMYEEAAFRRDIPALLLVGYGIGPPAVQTARQIYDANLLATPDTVTGQRMRGLMLAFGSLRAPDLEAGEAELTTCANLGNSICEAMLGYIFQSGMTGQRDTARALPYYESSAGKGNMYGQFYLGTVYEYGEGGVARDLDKAIEYFKAAALQGHLSARNRLSYYNQPLPN
jgi:TPR repeat protein